MERVGRRVAGGGDPRALPRRPANRRALTLGVIGWRRTAKGARRGRLIAALGAGLNAVLLVAWLGVFALAGSAAYVLQGAETTANNFAAAVAAGRLDAAADLARPPLDRGEIAWRASAFADPRARWALRTAINDIDGPTLDTVHVDARLTAAAPRRTVRFRLKLERDGLGYRVVGFDADDREPVRERADRRTRTEPPATPPATAPAP